MKYRIRDFVWLMLAVGVALGWYVDRKDLTKTNDDVIDFDKIGDYDTDYQFFEPTDPIETEEVMPFELRTRNALDQQPRTFRDLDVVDEYSPGAAQEDSPQEGWFRCQLRCR